MERMKRKDYLPYCQVSINDLELESVSACLKSGWLTMGHQVISFEKKFAQYIGVKYALAVNSCTAALELALLAHGIGPGDQVLVPSFTFVSTVNVILHVGATPIFLDIDPKTLNIDPADIERKITSKCKAIIPVHYAGLPVNLTEVNKLAKKHRLIVIEDAAHAVGSKYKNKYIGAHGNTTCFSFYATKTMTTGEGGMLTTNSSKIANYVMRNRLHGISKDAWKRYSKSGTWKYDVINPGMKCNMTDIQAAIGTHQLDKLAGFIEKRAELVALYNEGFANNSKVETIALPPNVDHSYHLYPVLLNGYKRDSFIQAMADHNIGTSVHFIPVHHFTYYKKNFPVPASALPNTNSVFKKIVSLPLYPTMTTADAEYVIKTVNYLTQSKG